MTKGALKPTFRVTEPGDLSDTSSTAIYTPRSSSPEKTENSQTPSTSRRPSPLRSLSPNHTLSTKKDTATDCGHNSSENIDFYGEEDVNDDMDIRPPLHRPTDGRSQQPLLKDEGRGRTQYESPHGSSRPNFAARRSTFRSRSPDLEGSAATRKKYIIAAFFLLVSLVAFVVQTETAVYIQKTMGWQKAYCML